jgi:GT2 family glycosyltransferase
MSPIDWGFRHQRPQQIAIELVRAGRKVLYLNPNIQYSLDEIPRLNVEMFEGVYVGTISSNFPARYIGINAITEEEAEQFAPLIEHNLVKYNFNSVAVIMQQPAWLFMAERLANNRIIFDCMDDHIGFDNVPQSFVDIERSALKLSDVAIVTSEVLADNLNALIPRDYQLIRNGVQSGHFSRELVSKSKDKLVLGYFGAIAEWFDIDLMAAIAKAFPTAEIHLIGEVSYPPVRKSLSQFQNVTFFGEIPYEDLPEMIASWNVALIPFLVNRLTRATNPVKLYEYSSAALPTVATNLPEVSAVSNKIQGVYVAESHEEFILAIRQASELPESALRELQVWASGETWGERIKMLLPLLENEVHVSVVVLMWNNALKTIQCLDSILHRSDYGNLEIILVDNDSEVGQSGSVELWIKTHGRKRITYIRNSSNLGFSAGNNVGIKAATGEFVVLLNNDTEVTPGWVHRSLRHFRENPKLGILGPSTDNCGNQAKVILRESSDDWLDEIISRFAFRKPEVIFSNTLAFFCVFIKREVICEIGGLDEAFGRGYFEDDDYCRRVEESNRQIAIARDVFVHHDMDASFGKIPSREKKALFNRNKKLYEAKWGKWIPPTYAFDEDQW